ncbi:hypothetical protein GCM10009654_31200 [Streptomyces hebeiensis]|uniref:Uncharacterized protein n=1 Tax=Streptomyces hebeiensis TaxID=229486 RepID=A0ABN1UVB4_9ACTN
MHQRTDRFPDRRAPDAELLDQLMFGRDPHSYRPCAGCDLFTEGVHQLRRQARDTARRSEIFHKVTLTSNV